jgi:hypothetical protein
MSLPSSSTTANIRSVILTRLGIDVGIGINIDIGKGKGIGPSKGGYMDSIGPI